jgi:hypothetical protein
MLGAAECLPTFDRHALVVWARPDRVMPLDYGRRLAELVAQRCLVEIADSYTLIPQDQPARLAEIIRQFTHEPSTSSGPSGLDNRRRLRLDVVVDGELADRWLGTRGRIHA